MVITEDTIMKKSTLILSAIALASIVSCQKDIDFTTPAQQKLSFEASMAEVTKTSVDPDLHVHWSDGDLIDVYGYTKDKDVQKAVFEITNGAGSTSATFTIKEGETLDTFDSYFAVYPSGIALKTESLPGSIEVKSTISTFGEQAIVKDGYDPAHAIMVAKLDGGKLVFKHGVSYFRIQIPEDGITKVSITAAANAFQKRPVYSAEDGSITANNSGIAEVATVEGSFVKGSNYYLCAIPRVANSQKLNGITVTYTRNGVDMPVSSTKDAIKNLYPLAGHVYDLGCPPAVEPVPEITADDITVESSATGGSIAFSVKPNGSTGGVLTATLTDGQATTIGSFALGTVGSDSIPFTCAANTETSAKYAYVTLTYTYTLGATKTVTKNVVVTQKAVSSGATEDYVWDFGSSEWQNYLETKEPTVKDTQVENYNWSVSFNGLSYTSGNKDKWSAEGYIQPNGKGTVSSRCFKFTVSSAGKVKVTVTNPKSSENASSTRVVKVKDSSQTQTSDAVLYLYPDKTNLEFNIAAGDVTIYPDGNGLRFWKIEFHSN